MGGRTGRGLNRDIDRRLFHAFHDSLSRHCVNGWRLGCFRLRLQIDSFASSDYFPPDALLFHLFGYGSYFRELLPYLEHGAVGQRAHVIFDLKAQFLDPVNQVFVVNVQLFCKFMHP